MVQCCGLPTAAVPGSAFFKPSNFGLPTTVYCIPLLFPIFQSCFFVSCFLCLVQSLIYCHYRCHFYTSRHTSSMSRLSSSHPKQGIVILLPFQWRHPAWRAFTATPTIGWPSPAQQALFFLHHVMSLIFIHFSCIRIFQFSWDQMVEHQIHNEPLVIIMC